MKIHIVNKSPLLSQAQLSKLRFRQALERRRVVGVRVSAFRQVRF